MKSILAAVFLFIAAISINAADPAHAESGLTAMEHGQTAEQTADSTHAGPPVTPEAPTLFYVGPVPVTNAMVYTWIIGFVIFVIIRLGTRKLTLIPSGLQNGIEAAVEGLENLTKGMLEPKVAGWCFPLVATYFIFIVLSNLMGLLPGVGSIGFGHHDTGSSLPFALHHADVPLFRPPTADANTTVAMAGIFFIMSTYWAIKYNG
ncbi:MAG: F0F1 ATP synthase subunit A, partial [Verrucomicrobiota bacterium]